MNYKEYNIKEKYESIYYSNNTLSLPAILENIERDIICKELLKNDWNISKTSRELGIMRQALQYKIKKYKIEKR